MKRFAHGRIEANEIPLMELSGDLMESPVFLDDSRTISGTEHCTAEAPTATRVGKFTNAEILSENRFPSESTSSLTSSPVEKRKKKKK